VVYGLLDLDEGVVGVVGGFALLAEVEVGAGDGLVAHADNRGGFTHVARDASVHLQVGARLSL